MAMTVQRIVASNASSGSGVRLPENSELRKVARDVVAAVKYRLCAVAAEPEAAARSNDSLGATFGATLLNLANDRRQRYQKAAIELIEAPDLIRRHVFGRYAIVPPDRVMGTDLGRLADMTDALPLDRKLLGLPAEDKRGPLDVERFESVWGPLIAEPSIHLSPEWHRWEPSRFASPGPPDPNVPYPGYYRRLDFMIRWIHCVDETNPEMFGSDEIAIGGVGADPDGGVKKIASQTFTEFDDGNKEWFSPHWVFASFERPVPTWENHWRHDTYMVHVSMAEKDEGGFGEFLDEMYSKIDEEVQAAVASLVAGGSAPFVGPYLAAIAGAVAAWAVNELIEWFITWFEDDPFAPQFSWTTAPRGLVLFSPPAYWDGEGWRTPEEDLHFYGHGGHYAVRYYWRYSDWMEGAGQPPGWTPPPEPR